LLKRKFVFLVFFVMFMVCLCLPAFVVPLSEADKAGMVEVNAERAASATFTSIFGNNLFLALVALVPLAGVGFTSLVLFNTGVVAASYPFGVLTVLLNPFSWLEVLVYALACTCGYYILMGIREKDWKWVRQNIERGVCYCTLLLLVFAFVEYLLISGGL